MGTFSRKEIQQIISRAAKIQSELSTKNDMDGLTESELKVIARDSGISEEALHLAIDELKIQNSDTGFNWLTGTGSVSRDAVLPVELTLKDLESYTETLHSVTNEKGRIEKNGTAFEWITPPGELEIKKDLVFYPKNGRTLLKYKSDWNSIRFLGLLGSAFFGGIAAMVMLKSIGLPKATFMSLAPLGSIIGYITALIGLNVFYRKQRKQSQNILESLKAAISRSPEINLDEALDLDQSANPEKKIESINVDNL